MKHMKKKHLYILLTIGVVIIFFIFFLVFIGVPGKMGKDIRCKDFNLLVITLDTTRADRIGAYGHARAQTPNLDRLIRDGVMFENCYTSAPITLASHCSMFTGKYPLSHGVRDNATFFLNSEETTLAEKMKENGFNTYAVIASYVLLSKFGLNQGFDTYDDSLYPNEIINNFDSEIPADHVYSKFRKWFDSNNFENNNKGENKFFAWVHFYDPHAPYNPPAEYKKKFGSRTEDLYDAEISYMDHYVGKIIDDLKNKNLLDHTLIVIAGDHGEGFGEHGENGHSLLCYEESLRVPLVFYNPQLLKKGLRIPNRTNLIDMMPTLLEMYGIAPNDDTQGKSLTGFLAGQKDQTDRPFYFESMHGKEELGWAPLTGIIDGHYKYISVPEPELYDLSTDKNEKHNLFLEKNRLARDMDKQLAGLVKTCSTATTKTRRQLTEKDKQSLQSLGYISAFSGHTSSSLDPKRGIRLMNRYNEIEKEIDNGQLDAAKIHLDELVGSDPQNRMPQYYGMLNTIYKKKNDINGVIDTWKRAIEAYPKNDNFRINLAFEFYHLERLEESDQLALDIIKNDPTYTRAYILRSRIAEKKGHLADARTNLETALSQEPQNVSLKISYARLLGLDKQDDKAGQLLDELATDTLALSDPSVKSEMGVALTEIHQDEKAFPLLSEAASSDKANAETWNYLGILHYRRGELDKAEDAYNTSLAKDPKIAKTYNNLATLYLTVFARNRTPQFKDLALRTFNKALSLDANLVSALNGRASLFKFSNRVNDALNDWKKALVVDPGFTDAYLNLGITYIDMRARAEALKYLNICKAKYFDKLSPRDQQRLGRLILEAGGR
ncbi:MAG: sulfatase-like hydrolase/transferase [Candidatus Omnitrophota bacterium]